MNTETTQAKKRASSDSECLEKPLVKQAKRTTMDCRGPGARGPGARGPGARGPGARKSEKVEEKKEQKPEEEKDATDESSCFCIGCGEEKEECCCQRCPCCDKINPEAQRHVFCKKECSMRIQFLKGLIDYID